ncbi:MAG: PDZ domain-containing protein [Planctomycetota bacterium]|jgi:hypothetical protein
MMVLQRIGFGVTQFIFLVLLLAAPALGEEAGQAVKASALLNTLRDVPAYEPVWELGAKLVELGDDVTPRLRVALKAKDPSQVLAAGYALLKLGEQREGTEGLLRLALSKKAPHVRRVEAISVLGSEGGEIASVRLRSLLENEELEDVYRVELAKSLWKLTRGDSALETLRALTKSDSLRARREAALALVLFTSLQESRELLSGLVFLPGRDGDRAQSVLSRRARASLVESNFIVIAPLLRRLAEQPTHDLGTAQMLLDVSRGVDKQKTADHFTVRLLTELLHLIRKHYVRDSHMDKQMMAEEKLRLSGRELAGTAAKALVGSIDPYSTYLDEGDIRDFNEQIGGKYGGIGAWVGMRNGRFTILLPMYGEPAHDAGLKAMDWVEAIDGEKIKDLSLKDIIKRLKGEPRTKVTLSIWRRG